jgi:hypothetical protein
MPNRFTSEILNAFEGICFVTNVEGVIQSVGEQNWEQFAYSNNAPNLNADSILGRNFFDFVAGETVKQHLDKQLRLLVQSDFRNLVLPYRCDSPDIKRNMRQSITLLVENSKASGFLFQSVLLNSKQRPPLDIFDVSTIEKSMSEDRELEIIYMCSYCQKVKSETYTQSNWIEAEDYYRAGGHSNVRISHGLCMPCADDL